MDDPNYKMNYKMLNTEYYYSYPESNHPKGQDRITCFFEFRIPDGPVCHIYMCISCVLPVSDMIDPLNRLIEFIC